MDRDFIKNSEIFQENIRKNQQQLDLLWVHSGSKKKNKENKENKGLSGSTFLSLFSLFSLFFYSI